MALKLMALRVAVIIFLVAYSATAEAAAATTVIHIPNGAGSSTSSLGYSPNIVTLVIGVNATVNWVNDDVTAHTVTSNDNRTFDSGNLDPGNSFSFTFGTAGTYSYHCSYHSWMHGIIKVVSASAVPEFPGSSLLVTLFVVAVAIAIVSRSSNATDAGRRSTAKRN